MKIEDWRLKRAIDGGTKIHTIRQERDHNRGDTGSKRLDDEILGKIGEEAICQFLNLKDPDYDLYDKPIHDYDLPELKASVKTAGFHLTNIKNDKNGKNGASFLIPFKEVVSCWQTENELGDLVDGYMFEDPEAKFIFILADQTFSGECDICGWYYLSELRRIWKDIIYPPYKPSIKTKKAIYLEDLKDLLQPLETLPELTVVV